MSEDDRRSGEGFRITVTPHLCCRDAARAIEFYRAAFGAVEVSRLMDDRGRVSHADLEIGGAPIMLADEHPEIGVLSPQALGGTPVTISLGVEDADLLYAQAVAAGAKAERPVAEHFDGALRYGYLRDPFGHRWNLVTRRAGG